ncbi:MAG: hypothetical protein GY847_27090 [Proteobacteria bacterium]|nr:hypothetical protein [Pseudomonadota bacterium]
MNRREFCRTGAVVGAAATGMIGTVSCGSISNRSTLSQRVARLDMDSYLAEFDTSMRRIDGFTCNSTNPCDAFDQLGRSATRSLGVSSMFRDLPLEGKLHPGMQRRVFSHLDEMDQSVFGGGEMIASSGLASDPGVIAAIQGPENPGMKFLERFDRHAADGKISNRKRYRLRKIGIDAVERMRRQCPEVVFDDAYAKVKQMQRTAELCGSVEEANRRATIMRVGREAYENREREIAQIIRYYDRQLIASNDPNFVPGLNEERPAALPATTQKSDSSGVTEPACPNNEKCGRAKDRKSAWDEGFSAGEASAYKKAVLQERLTHAEGVVTAGAWTLGVAGGVAAVGGILALVSPIITLVVSGTVGGTLLIVGLIILSVGGVKKNRVLRDMNKSQ